MMPVAAYNLLQSISLLASSADNFADQCVKGLQATDTGPAMVEKGLMLGTGLSPAIGYDKAAEITKEAAATGSTIRKVAGRTTSLTEEQLDELLDPGQYDRTGPRRRHRGGIASTMLIRLTAARAEAILPQNTIENGFEKG